MEVHQHTHTPRKKWMHYFWEFFMLFLAVTLGFFVENKREHYVEHKRAKAYAKLLKKELVNDTIQINSFLDIKDSIKNSHKIIRQIFKTEKNKITLGQLTTLSEYQLDQTIFIPNDAIYLQLKNSGNLRYFTNIEISGQLALYESYIKQLQNLWTEFKSIYGGFSSEHILQHNITTEDFIKDNNRKGSDILIKNSGYNFNSWRETEVITINIMDVIQRLNDDVYPVLKNAASDILLLLNKEYHLK